MENVKDAHVALKAVIAGAHELKGDKECPYDVALNLDKVVRHVTRIHTNLDFLVNKHGICEDPNPFFVNIVDDIQKGCEDFLAIHAQYAVPHPDVAFFDICRLNHKICTVANRLQNFKVSLSLMEPISNHVSESHLRKVAENVAKVLAPSMSAEHIEALEAEIENGVNRIRTAKAAAKKKPSEESAIEEEEGACDKITTAARDDAKIIENGLKTLEATGLALTQVMATAEKLVEPADVYSELKRPVDEIAGQMKRIQEGVASLAKLFQCDTLPQPFFLGMVEDIGIICAEFLAVAVELDAQLSGEDFTTGTSFKLGQSAKTNLEAILPPPATIDMISNSDSILGVQPPDVDDMATLSKMAEQVILSPTSITLIPEEEIANELREHPLTDICAKFEEIRSSLQTFDFNLEMAEPMIEFLSTAFVQQTTNEVVKTIANNPGKKKKMSIEAEELQLRRMMQLQDTDLPDEVVFGMKTSDSMKDLLASESESRTYFSMGVSYFERYIEKNYIRAYYYMNRAYEMGEKNAAFYLGELYYNGLGVQKDYIKAFKYYQIAAKNGDGESLSRVGWCLSVGHGTELNTLEAIRHYKLAYEKNSPSGMYHYGHALFYGITMEPDPKKGHDILYKAMIKRVVRAKLELAHCYECGIETRERSTEMAHMYAKDAYDVDIVGAWKVLARYSEHGIGTRQDFAEAARICKKQFEAAGIEKPDAQAYYGMCLVTGRGVKKDVRRGMKLIRSGCVPNRCDGWRLLADCYRYGAGVPIDAERAVLLYEKSAAGLWGIESKIQANLCLGEMHEAGEGVEADTDTAVRYYMYAADRYNPVAQTKLAAMYEEGTALDKDLDRAFHYYYLAARSGHPSAQTKVQELEDMGIGKQKEEIESIDDTDKNMSIWRRIFEKLSERRRRSPGNRKSRTWDLKNSRILKKYGRAGNRGDSL